MRIDHIELSGYGPFLGEHSFAMTDRGLVLVLGENLDEPRMNSNGSGKSSLFDSIDWALFGVVPKGDHVDSIIHDEAKVASAHVHLWDEDRNLPLVVERRKEKGRSTQLQFTLGSNPPVTALDLAETQRLLELELGLDREVFHATVFYGQADTFHFAEATESRRMELLSRILPELAVIDGWAEKAKAKSKALAEQEAGFAATLGQINARILEAQNTAQQAAARMATWEQEREARLAAMQNHGTELAARVEQHKAALAGEAAARDGLAQAEAAMSAPRADVATIDNQLQIEQRGVAGHASQEGQIRGQMQVVQTALAKLQRQQAGVCSQCGQPVTAEHLAQEQSRFQGELGNLERPLAEIRATMQAAQDRVAQLQAQRSAEIARAESMAREQQGKFAALRRQVDSFGQLRAALESEDRELQRLRQEWASIRVETNPWSVAADDQTAKIAALQAEASQATEAAASTNVLLAYVDFWVDAFANKGLKNYILDNRLGEMTDAANHWVRLLTEGTIWIRFETQKLGRSTKRLSNDINIRVFRYNPNGTITERNYRSWSGGEKRRVSWAIDFGLSRLVAARSKKRWDALVLDEVFKHVDSKGGEAVVEMLHYLRRERSSIFVVEHDENFKAHFAQRVLVRKQQGRATIVEINDEQQKQQGLQSDRSPDPTLPPKKKKQAGKAKRRRVSTRAASETSGGE